MADEFIESMKASASPRDWPEDFDDDNGCYWCRCVKCGESFTGYKRRVVCKLCARHIDTPPAHDGGNG